MSLRGSVPATAAIPSSTLYVFRTGLLRRPGYRTSRNDNYFMRLNSFKKSLKNNSLEITPSQEWKEKSRDMVLSQIRQTSAWKESGTHHQSKLGGAFNLVFAKYVLKPVAISVLAIAVVTSSVFGTAQAAQAALPGDSLYPIKLGIENAQVSLAFSEEKKTELEISFANTRLEEVVEILEDVVTKKQEPEKLVEVTKNGKIKSNVNVKEAITDFNKKMDSVQKRLEKIEKDDKSEKSVLKISNLVNEKTLVLEENLLQIKEKVIQGATTDSADSTDSTDKEEKGATTDSADSTDLLDEEREEAITNSADSADSANSTDSTDEEGKEGEESDIAPTSTEEAEIIEIVMNQEDEDLLDSINVALSAIDDTNTKSLKVFVGKAVKSENEEAKKEAVEKLQAKIKKVEKDITDSEEKIEKITSDVKEGIEDSEILIEVLTDSIIEEKVQVSSDKVQVEEGEEDSNVAADSDDSTNDVDGEEGEATVDEADSTDEDGEEVEEGEEKIGIVSTSTSEILIKDDKKEESGVIEEPSITEEKSIKKVIEDVQGKPKQAKSNINDAKKLLEDISADGLGEALGKMLQAKEIVKQTSDNIDVVEAEITKQADEAVENEEKENTTTDGADDVDFTDEEGEEDEDGKILGEEVDNSDSLLDVDSVSFDDKTIKQESESESSETAILTE